MKTFIILLTALLSLFNQQEKEPFTDANIIKISTSLSGNEAYMKWGKHLSQNGYSIERSNNDFLTIETLPRNTTKFNYEYKVFSSIDDKGNIMITAKWRMKSNPMMGITGSDYFDWAYAKSKNNVKRIIFDELYQVIASFGTYEISFEEK